jgi:hypothetical protein
MKHQIMLIISVIAACAALVGTAVAQSSQPETQAAAITTKFTYQGQLKRDGALFNGTCDMQFNLWDADNGGTQLATYTPPAQVNVTDGVFAVELDFGAQFKGEARWLETTTKCADDADFTTLPRVALTPMPYALGLMPGAQIEGSINGSAGILRASNDGAGAALVGLANSTTGTTYGVLGNASSPNGYAIWGYASNNATAMRGFAADGGRGVWGSSLTWQGVFGESRDNVGVVGTSTNFDGVWGETEADNANGVIGFGKDPCPNGSPAICSATHVRNATGVAGEAFAYGTGVWGRSASGNGVYGETSEPHTFDTSGVYGKSTGDGGIGVIGEANVGNGWGVYGISAAGSGVVGKSTTGYAGYFYGKVGIAGGADLAERFATADDAKIEPGTVMVIDDRNSGKLKVSDSAYDSKVVGIISGAGGINTGLTLHQDGALEGDLVVAIAGRVYCKAEANSAPIKPGDLLTTSSVKGNCMKATERDKAYGAVIGKALTGLDKGEGLVLIIVNLQ